MTIGHSKPSKFLTDRKTNRKNRSKSPDDGLPMLIQRDRKEQKAMDSFVKTGATSPRDIVNITKRMPDLRD